MFTKKIEIANEMGNLHVELNQIAHLLGGWENMEEGRDLTEGEAKEK